MKEYAAFIQNTITPLIEKYSDILWIMEKNGIVIEKKDIREVLQQTLDTALIIAITKGTFALLLAAIVCYTVITLS